jgi:peptide deformylase
MAILPIVTYNDQVLRTKATPVKENSDNLQQLIDDMLHTMYNSKGVGLAAPQIGKEIRLFVIDADPMTEDLEDEEDLGPMVFLNPEIISTSGDEIKMEEGCLSIPEVRDDVARPETVEVSYLDRNFEKKTKTFKGFVSRVVQHENDHLNGVLFVDYLSAFRRRLHRSQLKKIQKGTFEADYPLVEKSQTVL